MALIPFYADCQTISINSFLGVNFGLCREEAVEILKKEFAYFSFNEQQEMLLLYDWKFMGKTCKSVCLKFTDDRFYEGSAEFASTDIVGDFNMLKLKLVSNYGYGQDRCWFEPPYYLGDGRELTAVQTGNGKLFHYWSTQKSLKNGDFIVLESTANGTLRITFQNHFLASLASEKYKQLTSNTSDY